MIFAARRRRGTVGWIAMLLALAACLGLSFLPSPYVVEAPGPTFDTLGSTDEGPLITVDGEPQTSDDDGSLTLLTVQLRGNPDSPLNWLDVVEGYLSPSSTLIPMESAFPSGQSVEESNEAGQIDMRNSQQSAIAAALIHEGYAVTPHVTVSQVIPDSPAVGILEDGDQILTVNGETAYDVTSISAAINAEQGPSTFTILRDGETKTVEITPVDSAGRLTVGIYPSSEFDFPIEVSIDLPNVGGPSAGMMFALGIIDKLEPGALTGGVEWAGTGTISALGQVGSIGGIVQKMYGAVDAGAEWFLAPSANCDEVDGNIPDGLQVVAVSTLDEAMTAIETVAEGGDTSALPTCSSSTTP